MFSAGVRGRQPKADGGRAGDQHPLRVDQRDTAAARAQVSRRRGGGGVLRSVHR